MEEVLGRSVFINYRECATNWFTYVAPPLMNWYRDWNWFGLQRGRFRIHRSPPPFPSFPPAMLRRSIKCWFVNLFLMILHLIKIDCQSIWKRSETAVGNRIYIYLFSRRNFIRSFLLGSNNVVAVDMQQTWRCAHRCAAHFRDWVMSEWLRSIHPFRRCWSLGSLPDHTRSKTARCCIY